jgi:hypothetical protein
MVISLKLLTLKQFKNNHKIEKQNKMNPYKFQFLDKKNNVIEEKITWCTSKQDAVKIANNYLAECRHNDVVKIKNFKAY